MATNKELTESILKLDADAETYGLNNKALAKLLKQLNSVKADDDELSVADVEEVKAHPYSIAEGKSVTCKKGILSHGDEIKADYLGGGQDALDALVKSKVVVKA